MTGWYPHVHGHRTLWHLLRPHEPNLLRDLKQAGVQIRWYGKNDLLSVARFADSVTSAESRGRGAFGPNPYALEIRATIRSYTSPTRGPSRNTTTTPMFMRP